MGTHEDPIYLQCSQRRNSDMNTELSQEDRESLISYRMERAYATLKEAAYNAAGNYFNTAVNRL